MPSLPRHPSLSDAANEALARGENCTPRMNAFALGIPPGEWRPYEQIGNFAYFSAASGPLEIAFDGSTDFMPWDAAMAINSGRDFFFRRINVRNPSDTVLTGMLYMGEAVISDHRQHMLGEMRINTNGQITRAYEGTVTLGDADWFTLVAATGSKREIWLAVERADGGAGEVKAYWRANSNDAAKVPAREIGLALDGITRLPFSDRIDVSTDAAFAGVARIRYWIVSYIDEPRDVPPPPEPNERLAFPVAASAADVAGKVTTNYEAANIWKLFNGDLATDVIVSDAPAAAPWNIDIDLGTIIDLSRIDLEWGLRTDAHHSPAIVQIFKSADGVSWQRVVGADSINCIKPTAAGQVVFTRMLSPGELKTQYVRVSVAGIFSFVESSGSGLAPKVIAHILNVSMGIAAATFANLKLYTKQA